MKLHFRDKLAALAGAVVLGARFGATQNLNYDFIGPFKLGGLFNLSGLNQDQVGGNTLALGEVIYFAKILKLTRLIGSAPISFRTS